MDLPAAGPVARMSAPPPRPFTIAVPGEDVDDLRRLLDATRWQPIPADEPWGARHRRGDAAWEEPDLLADDLTAFFDDLR